MSARRLLPLALFAALAGLLALGLAQRRHAGDAPLPSPLIGAAAPDFSLPRVGAPSRRFAPRRELAGQVWLLNVWASWCAPCRAEHPLLTELAREPGLALVGLDYKDRQGAAWLAAGGDPYRAALDDADGRVGLEWGVYGVPETFVVDRAGRVRFKHVGPLTPAVIEGQVLPLVRSLRDEVL